MERELTNRIDQVTELFKCDWLILSPSEISNRFLTSWTLDLIPIFSRSNQSNQSYNLYSYTWIIYMRAHVDIFICFSFPST